MADRSVVVRLRAEIAQFKQAMEDAAKSTKKVGDESEETGKRGRKSFSDLLGWVDKNSAHLNDLSNKAGLVGIALVGVAALAIKKWAEYDQAMSSVAATGAEARASIDDLRQAALDAGKATVYTATEAANAEENLAKAGVSVADILNGGLKGALNLAAAGQMDVADAAGIAATVMNQFQLKGSDAAHIADVLAASAGKANGEVSDFGVAMKYVGPVSAQLGVSLEETSGTLALLAQNGLLADSAGTGLRGMLLSLTSPTAQATKTLDKYNITAFDAQGRFVGLAALAGQLHDKLGGLTEAERSEALGRIFGNEQITTARILYAQGAQAVSDWTAKVNDSGYASVVAATKLNNLKGDWEQLSGSVETAFIGMGQGSDGLLRSLVEKATNVVNAFSNLPGSVQQGTLAIVGAGGLVLLGGAGLGKLAISVQEVKAAVAGMGMSMKTAGLAAGGIGIALGVATIALSAWSDAAAKSRARVDGLRDALQSGGDAAKKFVANDLFGGTGFMGWGPSVASSAKTVGLSIDTVTRAVMGESAALDEVQKKAGVNALSHDQLSAAAKAAGMGIADYGNAMMIVRKGVEQYQGDLATATARNSEVAAAAGEAASSTGSMAKATGVADQAAQDASTAIDDLTKALDALNKPALDVSNTEIAFQKAIDDASASLKEHKRTLDLNTEAGRANQSALNDLADAGAKRAEAILEQTGSEDAFRQTLDASRQTLFDTATSFGMSADAAHAYVDQVLGIPPTTYTQAVIDTANAQRQLEGFIAWVNSRSATINIRANLPTEVGVQRMGTYAGGGEVQGPGTETSDSILARLSTNEHVWSAAEVRGAGGHGRVSALRAAARSGSLPGLASGGAVVASGRAFPAWSSSSNTGPASVDNSRAYKISVSTTGPVSPSDLVRAARLAEALEPAWG